MQKKQLSKLHQLRYRKLMNNTSTNSNQSTGKIKPKGVFIEFPLIENEEHSNPVIQAKNQEQSGYKKNNYRVVRGSVKVYELQRKKDAPDKGSIGGLDIRKIPYLKNKKDEDSFMRVDQIKARNFSLLSSSFKDDSKSNLLRKTTESANIECKTTYMQKRKNMTNLQMAQSSFFYKSWKDRESLSPTLNDKYKSKKKYLYEKLAGKELDVIEDLNPVYEKRIKTYTQFLWKLQFSHNIYINLDLKTQTSNNKGRRVKAFIGNGNNSSMVKGLLKRRYWWTFSDDKSECSFIWTQIKIPKIFQKQKKSQGAKAEMKKEEEKSVKKKQKLEKKMSLDGVETWARMDELFNFKVLNQQDNHMYKKYLQRYETQKHRSYNFKKEHQSKLLQVQLCENNLMHNHLQNNFYLGNKKALFYSLREYYELIGQNPFQYIPLTFHIKKGFKDPQYKRFISFYNKRKSTIKKEEKQEEEGYYSKRKTRNIWIVKPGQNTNQGRGITVIDQIYQLNNIMKKTSKQKSVSPSKNQSHKIESIKDAEEVFQQQDPLNKRTYIVQMYLDRPFLYHNRKFDIRHYMLLTNMYGVMRAYWYEDGYIRTSSYPFNIDNFDPQIHLTNDAIQKKYGDYGKYQPYNKVSYDQFQRYLDSNSGSKKYNFKKNIVEKMKEIGTHAVKSVFTKISPQNQHHNFQIFGLDFMIDKHFKPWLIQINTNPCLDCSCPLLDRIIPYMVEQSLKLTVDVAYPPPNHYPNTHKHFAPMIKLEQFKYELIFDSQKEGEMLKNLYRKNKKNIIDEIGEISDDEQFKDDGKEIKLDDYT